MSALTQPCRRGAEGNGVCAVMSCPWMSREHKLFFTSPKQASVMVSIKRQEAKFCGGTKPAWHQLKTVHNKPCSLSPFHCSKNEDLNLEYKSYEEQLRELGWFGLKKRLGETLSFSTAPWKQVRVSLFSPTSCDRTMGNYLKLNQGCFRLNIRKKFLPWKSA